MNHNETLKRDVKETYCGNCGQLGHSYEKII